LYSALGKNNVFYSFAFTELLLEGGVVLVEEVGFRAGETV
jgi:hypothetical protein